MLVSLVAFALALIAVVQELDARNATIEGGKIEENIFAKLTALLYDLLMCIFCLVGAVWGWSGKLA